MEEGESPPPATSTTPLLLHPSTATMSASLKAYAERMQADYMRYRIAKESADSFYSRLAVFHSPLNPFRYYLNPLMKGLTSPPSPVVMDLSMKPMVGSLHPPLLPFTMEERKRAVEEERHGEKRQKIHHKRKVAKKLNFDEEKSSPVSGTLIRVLEEGETIPAVHKGTTELWFNCSSSLSNVLHLCLSPCHLVLFISV